MITVELTENVGVLSWGVGERGPLISPFGSGEWTDDSDVLSALIVNFCSPTKIQINQAFTYLSISACLSIMHLITDVYASPMLYVKLC